jgi:hypothetical protein
LNCDKLGEVKVFGGVGSSQPSLLKKSACLFLGSVLLSVFATDPSIFFNAVKLLTGGFNMETIHGFTAVVIASVKPVTSSIAAGIAANGLTHHLF